MSDQAEIYAAAYPLYRDRGWVPIKLGAGIKFPPPTGYTGHNGADPSYADMHAWATEEPDGNLAIRLPEGMIGVDVDAYDNKTGAATLAEAQNRWGTLPYSPRSTSRDDGVSGIRLYRIPAGTQLADRIEFPELGIGDIEIIQHHHRYVMGWPSLHPSGRTYQWLGIDDGPLDEPPALDDIPELPQGWLEALTKPEHNHADLGDGEPYNVRDALTDGQMTRRVATRLGQAVAACHGTSRHDHTRDHVLALLRYGKQGDSGVLPALRALQNVFVAAVGPDRPGGAAQAAAEFRDFVNNKRTAALLAEPDYDDWARQEPPPDDHHAGESDTSETGEQTNLEGAIANRMVTLRINREANRRLDDEENPPVSAPPIKNLTALLAEPNNPIRWGIDQLAPVNSRTILSAQYKAGKTIIVGNLARSLADREPFLGRFTVNSDARVMLIDDELSEDMLRAWLRDQNITNTDAIVDVVSLRGRVRAFNLLDDRCRQQWSRRLADLGVTHLVLDCLRPVLDALGLDESREAGKFLVNFDAMITDANTTDALLIQHMGHVNERARGDSRLEDWPDVIWRMVREDPDDPTSARYFSAVGRDVAVPEGRLGYDPATRRLTYAPGSRHDAKVEAARPAIIGLLAEAGEPLSGNAIEIRVRVDTEHKRDAIRKALAALVAHGIVAKEDGPRNAKLYRITHPCAACGLPVTTPDAERHLSCPSSAEDLL